jgi:hypothetical protein
MTVELGTKSFDLQAIAKDIDFSMPLAHMTTNSWAATIHEIRKQERLHWFLGLRQAELCVRDKEQIIDANAHAERKYQRSMRRLQRELDALNRLPELTPDEEDRIEELEDEIGQGKRTWVASQPLIRDAQLEYEIAKAERDRILQEHPEAQSLSFEELQKRYTLPALVEVHARYVAARIWSAQNGVPESVGSMLFELAPQEQEVVMRREVELRSGVEIGQNIVEAARRIASLPEAQRQLVVKALSDDGQHEIPFYMLGE